MKYFRDNGYHTIGLGELASLLQGQEDLPNKAFILTFDDGFRNFYSEAFEVLNDCSFTATVFLVTDHCGKQNDWAGNPPELGRRELLSWHDVRELSDLGIEFGSHTRTHPDLTKLSADAVEDEILTSKKVIENKLGREASIFAYPFGRSNSTVERMVKAHYSAACSTNLGKVGNGSDLTSLNRLDAYYLANQQVFKRLSTPVFDGYMSVRQVGRSVKALLAGG